MDLSPGITVLLVAIGFVLVVFGIWAIHTYVRPYIRGDDRKPPPTLPVTEYTRVQRPDPILRQSLYGPEQLYKDPRETISDYDLKLTRYSTNVLELSRPASPSKSRPASVHSRSNSRGRSQSRARSRSRSRNPSAHNLARLRSSLYAETGLLSSQPRDSYGNLHIDESDTRTPGSKSRPNSLYKSRQYSAGDLSMRSTEKHKPISTTAAVRKALFSESSPFLNDPNGSGSGDLGYFSLQHNSSSSTSKRHTVSGYGYSNTTPKGSRPWPT